MCPREHPDLAGDVTDLVGPPPVWSDPLVEDCGAHRLLELGLERLCNVAPRLREPLLEGTDRLVLELVDRRFSRRFICVSSGLCDAVGDVAVHRVDDVLRHGGRRVLHRRLADRSTDLPLPAHQDADLVVRETQGLEDRLLSNLLRSALDHGDGVLGAGHHEVEIRLCQLVERGVRNEPPVDHADTHAADRPTVRDAADLQRARRTGHRERRGVLLLIGAQHRGDDLDIVAEVLGEERSHGAVDHAAGENGVLARPALAAGERPRNATRRVQLLLVVAREREEVDALARRPRRDGRDEQHGVAGADHKRAVGLLGDMTGFDRDRSSGQLCLESLMCHVRVSSNSGPGDGWVSPLAECAVRCWGLGSEWDSRRPKTAASSTSEGQAPTSHHGRRFEGPAPGRCVYSFAVCRRNAHAGREPSALPHAMLMT